MIKLHTFPQTEGVQNLVQNCPIYNTWYRTPTEEEDSSVPFFSRFEVASKKVKSSLFQPKLDS